MKPLIPYFDVPILEIPLPPGLPWHSVPIHAFGVLVALGFVFGAKVAMDRARRLGLDPEHINRLVGWLVGGTLVGGHIGAELMYTPRELFADPWRLFHLTDGLSSFGGFFTCIPLAWYYFRSRRLPFWPYADCLAHGLTVGWFFGRMGCFSAHDHPGSPTNFWLGVYGICDGGTRDVACHDMGLYEGLWSLSMFGLFTVLDRRQWAPGMFTALLGTLYAPTRFAMDFYRPESTDAKYLGLTPAQYGSVLVGLLCLGLLVARRNAPVEPAVPA